MRWDYEKLDEDLKIKYCPRNDFDGQITGKIIMDVPAYFDENPEERIRLGWIKHISYSDEEVREKIQYNPQTQYLMASQRYIDEHTVEDVFYAIDKTEEMMLFEDMLALAWSGQVLSSALNGIGGTFFEYGG